MTAPTPEALDAPRAQPDHDAMDDVAEYAQTLPRRIEPLEGMLVCECPEAAS